MTTLNYAIKFILRYNNNITLVVRKDRGKENEKITIAKISPQGHRPTQPITSQTAFKNLLGIEQNCRLIETYFTCSCEEGCFYNLDIKFDPLKNREKSIEDVITKIEEQIKIIPKETTYPVYIDSINTTIDICDDRFMGSHIISALNVTKDGKELEQSGTYLCYTDQNASPDPENKNEIFSLTDKDNAKKNIDNIFKEIVLKSNAPITEHERITIISEIQKRSHEDLIKLMKTRYHHHLTLEKECIKILENTL